MSPRLASVRIAAAVIAVAASARADAPSPPAAPLPPIAQQVDIDEHLGGKVNKDLRFTDSEGRALKLGDMLPGDKPLIVVLAYYRCPMLCGLVLKGAVDGLKGLDYRLGDQYRAITVSFNPKDTPLAAQAKQGSTLGALGATDRAASWPFVVGPAASSAALADELGFRMAYDPASDQYAHPAALFVLTPDGHIARYLYGVTFSPRDLRLALLDASHGKVGGIVNRVLMTCYHFDPASRRYGPFIFGFMRLGGLAILMMVGALLAVLWRGERRRRRDEGEGVS